MHKLVILLLIGFFLLPWYTYAWDHETEVHFAAHAGMSFASDTVSYGINNKVFGINKKDSKTLAFFETLMVGLTYKLLETNHGNLNQAMAENLVGAGTSTLTITVFEW